MHMNNHRGAGATEKKRERDLNINTCRVVKGLSDQRQCIVIVRVIVALLQDKYQNESQNVLCSWTV